MLGELTAVQCETFLKDQLIGRLGCASHDDIFVVPITFAYDGTNIYAHSPEGMKVDLMRKNPRVCLQVDHVTDMKNWQSVVAWGRFEELKDDSDVRYALEILGRKIGSTELGETATPPRQTMSTPKRQQKNIVYRIRVERKTGRFERT